MCFAHCSVAVLEWQETFLHIYAETNLPQGFVLGCGCDGGLEEIGKSKIFRACVLTKYSREVALNIYFEISNLG